MRTRSYSELILLPTFIERFEYLATTKRVGDQTFGSYRYLNQKFYRSREWRRTRNIVIERDYACDLGIRDREIMGPIYVHHMNPVTVEDIYDYYDLLLDPEFLISTSFDTHQAIEFGDKKKLIYLPKERRKGDTTLWR